MCFKCDDCGRVSEPREKMHRVPVEYRKMVYMIQKGRNQQLKMGLRLSKRQICAKCAHLRGNILDPVDPKP